MADTQEIIIARAEAPTPMTMLQQAVAQGADLDKLTKLMDLQDRWQANEARKAFVVAMNEFKADPPDIFKNKHVKAGAMEYDHATLDHVSDAIGKSLSKHGLSHRWNIEQKEKIRVTCVITHALGHSESVALESTADASGSKNNIQAIGSAVTYLQRYTLLAATGMAARGQDADGHAEPSAAVSEHVHWIQNAGNMDELKRLFTNAYAEATAAKDKEAQRLYIAAKNTRYKELA